MEDKKIVIQASEVYQTFRVGQTTVPVLRDVSFHIRDNTFTVIYGASGSGKSTLLNILTGLQPPTHGAVVFNGREIYRAEADERAHFRASTIGFIYQQNFWVQSLNTAENVALPLFFLGNSRLEATRKARRMLDAVGMLKAANRSPILLSSGEQQRVAVARALVSNPQFIVADEPTGSLDSTNGDMVIGLLRRSQKELNKTVIMVTHNMEYLPLADNLMHIHDGRLKQMPHRAVAETARSLLDSMKQRIDYLAGTKEREGA